MQMIGQIELTPAEQKLAKQIVFDVLQKPLEYEETLENGERAAALANSLMKRKAIPEERLRYFTDPEYNPGRGKESRFTYFRNNAGSTDKVFRHPHFLPYLRYFIYGADLPAELKQEFLKKAEDYWIKSGELAKFAQQLVRKYNLERPPLNYRLKEVFYQLALDCSCTEGIARSVREAVMKVK
jgi:hypothetical protein